MLMVIAYFTHVAPIYPILDDKFSIERSELLAQSMKHGDSRSVLLLKLMACTGAACMNDRDIDGNNIKYIREAMFSEVIAQASMLLSSFGIINVQIMVLIVSLGIPSKNATIAEHILTWNLKDNILPPNGTVKYRVALVQLGNSDGVIS
jgi:hypothetical protein